MDVPLKAIKVFCPVCDSEFADEDSVFAHLSSVHELSSSASLPKEEKDPLLYDDWVLLGQRDDGEEEEEEEEGEEWSSERIWTSHPSFSERRRMIRAMVSREPGLLHEMMTQTFPNGVPNKFFSLPMFGSLIPESQLSVLEMQLLCTIAHRFPEVRFCPIVPSLLHLVLSAIDGDAERCLSLIFALLQRKERLAALREGSPVSLIATNETQLRMLVSATHKLVLANCGKAVRSIENLAPHDYALEFCSSFFPELPAAFREHALVLWYRNGATAVMRIAIGLVGETVASVSGATSSRDAFLYALREAQKSANISWWMKVLARGLAVSRWGVRMAQQHRGIRENGFVDLEGHCGSARAPLFVPKGVGSILIAKSEYWDLAWTCVPERFKSNDPRVLFTATEGWSWQRLLRSLVNRSRVMLALRTRGGEVFGAVLVRGFAKNQGIFEPDREAKLFDASGGKLFSWEHPAPDYVAMWTETRISIGCDLEGKVALSLDSSLEQVHLEPCAVFANPALAKNNDLIGLEVYSF